MGVRNYLIEGVSGSGKTTVARELERRGYHVVHGDRVLAYWGDPETGDRVDVSGPEYDLESRHSHWIWDVAKVMAIVADHGASVTFLCGGSRNHAGFIDKLDGVFILEVDPETLGHRLSVRGDDEYGGRPEQRDHVLRLQASREDIPRVGVIIDSTAPVEQVVDEILSHCR